MGSSVLSPQATNMLKMQIFLFFSLFLSLEIVTAAPGGSSMGGVYAMKRAGGDSDYAFDLASMAEIIKSLGMVTELLKREKLLVETSPLTGTMLMPFLSMILLDMTTTTKNYELGIRLVMFLFYVFCYIVVYYENKL